MIFQIKLYLGTFASFHQMWSTYFNQHTPSGENCKFSHVSIPMCNLIRLIFIYWKKKSSKFEILQIKMHLDVECLIYCLIIQSCFLSFCKIVGCNRMESDGYFLPHWAHILPCFCARRSFDKMCCCCCPALILK